MGLDCLFCGEEIEDGEVVVDGQHGEAIARNEDEGWVGEVEFNSKFSTVHEDCFDKAEENFDDLED